MYDIMTKHLKHFAYKFFIENKVDNIIQTNLL